MKLAFRGSISLILFVCIVSTNTTLGWSLNPLKWVKKYDPEVYQTKLEENVILTVINYEHLMNIMNSCTLDEQATEDKIVEEFNSMCKKLIEFVKDNHEETNNLADQKRDLKHLYLNYPCMTYNKKLTDDINNLKETFKQYIENVKEKDYNNDLLEKVQVLLFNLVIFNELIIQSEELSKELKDYSQKHAKYVEQLSDISALAQAKKLTSAQV